MDIGCETDLRAVRDGLIGGVLREHLQDDIRLLCFCAFCG